MIIELKLNGNLVYASMNEFEEPYKAALLTARRAIEKYVGGIEDDRELVLALRQINAVLGEIPKDKNYPPDAVQCDHCGGLGCGTCEQKGWLPAGHHLGRKCERDGCGKPLPPNHVAVYCSNECAFADA